MKNVYLCSMKRATIWALGVGMSLSFLVLLFLQINYMTRFVTLRKAQFDENVNRSLSEAVSNVELNESRLYLENLVRENLRDSMYASEEVDTNVQKVRSHYTTFEQTTFDNRRDNRPKAVIGDVSRSQMGDVIKKMYMNRRATLDKAVYSMIEAGRGLQLKKRINFRMLDQEVKNELRDNGLMMPYHIKVLDAKGNVLYRCSDYSEEKNEVFYRAKMFKWMDDKDNAFVEVHFPDYSSYITGSMRPPYGAIGVLYHHFACNIRVYNISHIPSEKTIGNKKRLHKQHDARVQDSDINYIARCADAEGRESGKVAGNAEEDKRSY